MKNTAKEIEEAIISALLIDKTAILTVIDILKTPRVFYYSNHETIYSCAVEMFNGNENIDLLTIANKLKKQNKLDQIGGDLFLIELTQKLTSTAHVESHCRILQQMYIKREMSRFSNVLKQRSEDESEDTFDILDSISNFLNETTSDITSSRTETISEITTNIIQNIGKQIQGVRMPLSSLNRESNGWQNSDLIIVGARPGMGKSAYLNSIVMEANVPIGVFSLEMSKEQLVKRMIAYATGIHNFKIQKNSLNPYEIDKIKSTVSEINKMPVFIDDKAGISLTELKAKAKIMHRLHGIKILVVDYLQLITIKGKGNRENEISEISRGLKIIAKELNIPVIALSQLSRNVETRSDKRPMLSDLRESGAIEQDADIIQFIYRPEYYNLEDWDLNDPCKGQAEIIQAKNRNGILGAFRCQFIAERQMFCDLSGNKTQDIHLPEPKPVSIEEDLPF